MGGDVRPWNDFQQDSQCSLRPCTKVISQIQFHSLYRSNEKERDLCETHDLDLVLYDKEENLPLHNLHQDILDNAGFTIYSSSGSQQQLSEVNYT